MQGRYPNQQNPKQAPRSIDGAPGLAIEGLQFFSHEMEDDVSIDKAKQVMLKYKVFDSKAVEERSLTALFAHHVGSLQNTSSK